MSVSRISNAFMLVSGVMLAAQIVLVLIFFEKYQFDFRAYYFSSILLDLGEDPYSADAVFEMSRDYGLEPQALPFLYAPISIFFFKPISLLDFHTAYVVWLGLQTCAIVGAITLLVRRFDLPISVVLPVFAFGLNGTVAAALRHGQLELISLFLLLAALAMVRRNLIVSAALVAVASIPKIWLAPLSVLLLIRPTLRRVGVFIGTIFFIAGAVFSAALWAPELFAAFRAGNGNLTLNLGPLGPFRGSFVNFLATVERLTPLPSGIQYYIYGGWIVLVGILSFLALHKIIRRRDFGPRVEIHIFAIITLSLCIVSPRMLVYQWGIALPGIILAIVLLKSVTLRIILGFLALLPTIYISQYGFNINVGSPLTSPLVIPWGFSNIIVTAVAWLICVDAAVRYRAPENLTLSRVKLSE